MSVKILTSENFDKFVSNGDVVIDFYADWCGPCKIMEPHFKKAAESLSEIKFGKVNVDEEYEITGRFDVMSIPTIIFFKNGEQIDRHTGVMTVDMIKRKVAENFS